MGTLRASFSASSSSLPSRRSLNILFIFRPHVSYTTFYQRSHVWKSSRLFLAYSPHGVPEDNGISLDTLPRVLQASELITVGSSHETSELDSPGLFDPASSVAEKKMIDGFKKFAET